MGANIEGNLPKIEGTLDGVNDKTAGTGHLLSGTGAFSISSTKTTSVSGGNTDTDNPTIQFKASDSNSVYSGTGSVVRPTSVGVSMWKRVS